MHGQDTPHVQSSLCVGKFGIGCGFLTLPFGLEHSSLCIDLAYLLPGPTNFLGFSNLSHHASICNIDLGLVRGTLVGFTTERFEVLATMTVLELCKIINNQETDKGVFATLPLTLALYLTDVS